MEVAVSLNSEMVEVRGKDVLKGAGSMVGYLLEAGKCTSRRVCTVMDLSKL